MKIAVLTGGGDVPGLNPAIKALTYRAIDEGHQVIGFRKGWAGPLNYNPSDPEDSAKWFIELDKINTRRIDREGGTFLHTSRTHPSSVPLEYIPDYIKPDFPESKEGDILDLTPYVLKSLAALEIDVIVPIGGEDTLGYAARLHREGFPIVSIPKTMDNDVFGTDYCIGFSTAVTRSVAFINQLRTSIGSHERLGVVELFGRHCGQTAVVSSLLAGADRCLIAEVPFDPERLAHLVMEDKRHNPSNYAIVAVSEGAHPIGMEVVQRGEPDAYGHRKLGGIGMVVTDLLKEYTGENTIYQQLAYLMRSGQPDSLDLMVAVNYANMAMDLIQQGLFGQMVA
ncbi:MAG: 6-phosphofructokinase, partial [Anaerolineae bacterium]|nr:6-phosphofructokinase [Anaerolineae bacterium]